MSAHANAAYIWATAAYSRTKHVMHNSRRLPTSHSSQAHGAPASLHWPNVLFVPDSSGPKLTAPLYHATGTHVRGFHPHSRGRGRTDPPPHREFRRNTYGSHDHCNPPSRAHAVGAALISHSRHAKNFARKRLLLPLTPPRHDPMPGRLPGVRQALQLPY
ncbi:hypothetical protein TcCL_Unassigned02959 [Trypanosoma cruzi]|nr:hypothetical protein TcCL_Unassigned02959 [Trypanosoma cruzi]